MNEYRLEDIIVNETSANFSVEITTDMVNKFYYISGDCNPMHLDKEYAVSKGFSDKIVYGMLIASFYSKLVGVYLPGKYCILQELQTSFYKPVFVGDQLVVSGYVSEKDERLNRMTVSAKIVNKQNKRVSKAKIVVGFLYE